MPNGGQQGPLDWLWQAALLAAAFGAGWFALRRRKTVSRQAESEREAVPPSSGEAGVEEAIGPSIVIHAEAVNLARSMMNATLQYRLSITNRTQEALGSLEIGGDLVAAHNRRPIDEQIAAPSLPLALQHRLARLAPGQTVEFVGTLRLPLAEVQPIFQANAPLLVPLMRWRAAGSGAGSAARTWVVGMLPQAAGGRLHPFRLDEQPQTYAQIGSRPID